MDKNNLKYSAERFYPNFQWQIHIATRPTDKRVEIITFLANQAQGHIKKWNQALQTCFDYMNEATSFASGMSPACPE